MVSKPKNNRRSAESSDFEKFNREFESSSNWSERSERREDRIQSVLFWIRVVLGFAIYVFILLFFAAVVLMFLGVTMEDKEFVLEFFRFTFVPVLLVALILVSGPLSKLKDIISFFRR